MNKNIKKDPKILNLQAHTIVHFLKLINSIQLSPEGEVNSGVYTETQSVEV